MGNYEVVDATWFTQMGGRVIGIVMVKTVHDGTVFYIGTGIGDSEDEDSIRIAERGAHFPYAAGMKLFNQGE